ncbi:MAG: Leucine-tRNA ligase [Candidatus Uhrbacteria bacterium GW2011_GWE2_45_35]|uniref:Leucine--tRNA ligase n=2 Tax=Candidatus Uhriibacteriota TaxID=1752732 RepID=A0A0G1JJD3_9BACT|nr:MAG: Leucine-tRNA ligase [Candidatus Uhrbacteria bacterium GW2011_GWF2_44_350]KKU08383.1 MAG: Leucine-tRNA ligase [Candidatus Uhrbacteria bacterium GW2011_GWE2_45_35]
MPYDHQQIEKKWREKWETSQAFKTQESPDKPKFYALDMFPYPSGAGLHVGHPKGYIATDVIARMKMMQGFNVLHPMGWDAFGLPAENYAIKNKVHPSAATAQNIEVFKKQLSVLGFTYDWDREVNTTDPKYYKWTQWAFLQMFKNGLAFESNEPVNWCPSCKTVLANEDLEGGNCERCGTLVEQKPLRQWVLKITNYAERLLNDLEKLPDWPESIKQMQREWIGRSEGAEVNFHLSPNPSPKGRGIGGAGEVLGYMTTDGQMWNLLHDKSLKMRKNPTQAEQVMWKMLRRDATGFHFRRQQIIGNFIVDFVCIKKGLVIEVDGDIHDYQKEEDENRTKFLNERGFQVIRFHNNDVFNKTKEVVETIVKKLESIPGVVDLLLLGEDDGGVTNSLPLGEGQGGVIKVFTTRPDTLFGATYMVLAPEHPLASEITTAEQKSEVENYLSAAKNKTAIERGDDSKEKTGVFTGAYAINPVNDEEIPIWVADYVLWGYGTGAIMAVPAHDERDHAFACKYNLPEKIVVEPVTGEPKENEEYRQSIVAVVRNPKTDEFLSINWGSELGGNLFVGGGRDEGEDPIECARREVTEETGYKNLRFISQTETIHHHYFAFSKNKQRNIDCVGLYFELEDEEQVEQKLEVDEKEKFKVEWFSAEEADKKVVERLHELVFDRLVKGECYVGDGLSVNSDFLNGLPTWKAKDDMISWLEEKGLGARKIQYKLRDWVFSRQRYWGEPIPLVHCEKCGVVPLPKDQLPLELPQVENYEPTGTGESPLANIKEWINTTCPQCGRPARRETNTMPQWAGSCWYYLRYMDPKNDENFFAKGFKYRPAIEATEKDLKYFSEFKKIYSALAKKEIKIWTCNRFSLNGLNRSLWLPLRTIALVAWEKDRAEIESLLATEGFSLTEVFGGTNYLYEKEDVRLEIIAVSRDQKGIFSQTAQGFRQDMKPSDMPEAELGSLWGFPYRILSPEYNLEHYKFIAKKEAGIRQSLGDEEKINFLQEWVDGVNDKIRYWSPIDLYVGGAEHATRHLIYARFWHKFLFDLGVVSGDEPFIRLQNVGLILAEDGRKMSKRWGNVVNPDDVVAEYGADALRVYEMFMGPFNQPAAWSTNGLVGARRFLEKVNGLAALISETESNQVIRALHQTIKKVGDDIAEFRFNTAIAQMMTFVNIVLEEKAITKESFFHFLQVLCPFAPHLTNELAEILGATAILETQAWPNYNPEMLVADQVTIVVQVNGKLRGTVTVSPDAEENEVKATAFAEDNVKKFVEGKEIVKVVYVKGKLMNMVVK